MSPLGFYLICLFCRCRCNVHFLRSTLVIHMPTSWQPALQPVTSTHCWTWLGFERAITRTEDERATIEPLAPYFTQSSWSVMQNQSSTASPAPLPLSTITVVVLDLCLIRTHAPPPHHTQKTLQPVPVLSMQWKFFSISFLPPPLSKILFSVFPLRVRHLLTSPSCKPPGTTRLKVSWCFVSLCRSNSGQRGFILVFAHFERNFVIYWNMETI